MLASAFFDQSLAAGSISIQSLLKGWTVARAYALTSAEYDSSGCITSAMVRWPDGSSGTYTTTLKNSVFNVPDSYTVTHVNSGLTVSQPAVTRNANGDITAQPTLSIA